MRALICVFCCIVGCYAQKQLFVYPRIVQARAATKNLVLRLNEELTLNLERSSVLADDLLFVTKRPSGHEYKVIDTTRIQENLYHDSSKQSSVYLTHEDGTLRVEGIIDSKWRIKPLLQSERSSNGQVLHSIYEAEEVRTSYKNVLQDDAFIPRASPKVRYTIRSSATTAPRPVHKFVVELHIISDEDHQKFFKKDQDLTVYLAVMLNAVNRIFIDMKDPAISFKLVGITRSKNDTFASPILGTIEAEETLERLVNYTRDNDILHNSDLVYLITGGNLARLGTAWTELQNNVAGLAYIGTVCTPNAVAEGEDIAKSYAGVNTMAHELAHSLGASHDPQNDSECSWSKGFLMSYEDKGSNKYRLSRCSQSNITDVIQRLSNYCLSETAKQPLLVNNTELPGDMLVRHYYCRKVLKENSRGYFQFEQDPKSLCKLRCYYQKPNEAASQRWYMTFDMPEGMWCGGNKTCQRGDCIEETLTKTLQN